MAYFLNLIAIFFCLAYPFPKLLAKDLGVYGHLFSIKEENILDLIIKKIEGFSDEKIIEMQNDIKTKMLDSCKEPRALDHITETVKRRVFYFDPTLCLHQDIEDHEGSVLIKKGTTVNPLEFINLNQELIFFDATQESHVKSVKSLPKETKWILVKGKPLELEEKENHPVFFDQFGALTKKLGIRCVPAKVSQVEKRLRIEEIPIETVL